MILLGIFAPPLQQVIILFAILGLIGFGFCYLHRYLLLVSLSLYLWLAYKQFGYIFFAVDPHFWTYMLPVYASALVGFAAIIYGAILNFRKHRQRQIPRLA